jgi:hypothetical protein
MTTAPERCAVTSDFCIDWMLPLKPTETLCRSFNCAKFEIHVSLCECVELPEIVVHCLNVLHKIDGQLWGQQDLLPCVLPTSPPANTMTVQATWKQVVQDFEDNNGGPATTIE